MGSSQVVGDFRASVCCFDGSVSLVVCGGGSGLQDFLEQGTLGLVVSLGDYSHHVVEDF